MGTSDKLSFEGAIWIGEELDRMVREVKTNDLKSRLLKGWLKELKTNALQRSINYAYACDIDLIHYGFINRQPIALAIHELKFGSRRIESNKAKLQFEIATKLELPFFFSQIITPDEIIVQRVIENGFEGKSNVDYNEWGKWQREMSRYPKREIVLPGKHSHSNIRLDDFY